MLGAHPNIATGQESQLFNNYLSKLYDQWCRELRYPETDKVRKHGITSYIDETQFISLLRDFATTVFSNVLDAKPSASLFLEKSPNNSFNIDLIYKCFPDAKYVHLIRDGRDVVTSMLAAKSGWGRRWAPDYAYDAAAEWVEAVSESKRLKTMTENYLEVRYEELLAIGPEKLHEVFEFLQLDESRESVADIYDRFAFDKLKANKYQRDVFLNPGVAKASGTESRSEPDGFFRKGIAGDWKNALSEGQLAEVNWVAGELLQELGYLKEFEKPAAAPASIRRRKMFGRGKAALKRMGSSILR